MAGVDPVVQEEIGVFSDLHQGSFLQSGELSVYRDTAVRRGFIDGKNVDFDWVGEADGSTAVPNVHDDHSQLRRAIDAIRSLTHLHAIHGGTQEVIHPTYIPSLPLAAIRVWKWGPHVYFELKYRYTRETNLPVPAALGAAWTTGYDHVKAYKLYSTSGGASSFVDGLPNGAINFPDPAAGASDPANRPIGTVHKRNTLKFVVKTILDAHPYITNGALPLSTGKINQENFSTFGGFNMGFGDGSGFLPFTTRFDGANINSIGVDKWAVTYSFTYIRGRHQQQEPRWDGSSWSVLTLNSHESVNWVSGFGNQFFPVAW